MKVYVASHDRWAACWVAHCLVLAGHRVVSTWHGAPFGRTEDLSSVEREAIAVRDVEEVVACECLVLVAAPDRYPGGKFVEAGIALGRGKPVLVLGRRENVLLWHPEVRAFNDMPWLLTALAAPEGGAR